jgi:hypothetical protein
MKLAHIKSVGDRKIIENNNVNYNLDLMEVLLPWN